MKRKKKVLIVSNHFPPLNSMAAKRYGFMCKYMYDNDYEPYVITTRARGGGYLNTKNDLAVPIPEENIIRIGAMGIQYPIAGVLPTIMIDNYRKKKKRSRIMEEGSWGWFEKVKKEIELEKLQDIDIVVGTFSPVGNLLVGKYIAKKLNIPFIAEIRDLISDYDENSIWNAQEKRKEIFLEKCLLHGVDGIIAVTDGFKRILSERYPRTKIVSIYNGWEDNGQPVFSEKKSKYMYYAGSLYEHRVEGLILLFGIIKNMDEEIEIRIRSLGPESLDNRLRNEIYKMGLQDRVKLLKPMPEKVIQREQAEAYINLLVSSLHGDDPALMATLPGKLFELMRVDSPILAIASEKAEIGNVLSMTKKGIATSDERKIRNFILSSYVDFKGNKMVLDYSRKNQTRKLCHFMDQLLTEKKG